MPDVNLKRRLSVRVSIQGTHCPVLLAQASVGRGLLWACARTLVPQGSGASAWAGGPARAPVPSPHHRPQVPCRLSVLHRPRPDVPSWGGTRGRGQGRRLFLPADGLRRSRLSFTRPDPGEVSGYPSHMPSQLYLAGHKLWPGLLPSPGACAAGVAADGLAVSAGSEGTERCSRLHGKPPARLENGSPARQTSSRSRALVWFFGVANVRFFPMLHGSARSPEPSAP